MNHRRGQLHMVLFVGLLAVILGAAAPEAQAEPPQPGMRVYVDPATGKFVDPPPVAGSIPQPRSERAVEPAIPVVPGTTVAGGVLAQIPPSLGAEIRAVVQPDGRLATECRQGSTADQ
jgi:hypothetical protein